MSLNNAQLRERLMAILRELLDAETLASITRLAQYSVITDARMLDFLSRKDARVYRMEADCLKPLLRLLNGDARLIAAPPTAETRKDAW